MEKPNRPCLCGADDWRQRPDGGFCCNRCHPNPDKGVVAAVVETQRGELTPEMTALRDRVIKGNAVLNEAWGQICKLNHNTEEWSRQMELWHQATAKLSVLCSRLKLSYDDCLYLNEKGKKTKLCLSGGDGIGCCVCPCSPDKDYWVAELLSLPSPSVKP